MAARKAVFEYVTDYFQRVLQPDFPAFFPFKSKVWKMADILPEKPGSVDNLLSQFKEKVELNGIHDGSARVMPGFNPNSGNYPSALGMLYMMLADIHNDPDWRVVDCKILSWLFGLVGYVGNADGFFTSGGSYASIVAMMAARDATRIPMAESDRAVVYLADTVHNCADKALKAVGLSRVIFRQARYDSQRKMVLSDLEEKIKEDLENDLCPFMVIGTIGEVDSGAIDPLAGIADIAAKYDVWFHVDAAYGGFFLLCDEVKEKAKGIERADSIIINLHKGLFQPYGSAAILLKNGSPSNVAKLFADGPVTVGHASGNEPLLGSPVEDSPPFRSFPAWMFLNTLGMKHVRDVTREKLQLADYMYNYLKMCPGIWAPIKPELSKVIFAMDDDDVEAANRKTETICKDLNKDGSLVMDTTMSDGRVYIHICISAFRTHIGDVDFCLSKLKKAVHERFDLKLPDIEVTTSGKEGRHLHQMQQIYNNIEIDLAKMHFPTLVANEAEMLRTKFHLAGLKVTDDDDDEVFEEPNGVIYPKPSLDLPDDPRSFRETLQTLDNLDLEQMHGHQYKGKTDLALLEPAVLGHFLIASTNRFSGQRECCPGNTELEEFIPDWLRTVTGFSDTAKGVLYNDSCTADTLCLFTARCNKLSHPDMYERAVVYGSHGSLLAISQPLHVLGLSHCQRSVVHSTDGLMDIRSLMDDIRRDLQDANRIPFLVALSVKPTGLEANHHDLGTLMALCQEAGIWVHIHVSDGAPYLLASLGQCAAMKQSGLSEADSISINLTKCLCQPQEVAAVLVRNQRLLLNSLQPQREANYFRDVTTMEYEPIAYGLELTRPSRAVAVWFAMYLHGAEKLRQHIATLQTT